MFAYCLNNPTNRVDKDGRLASWIIGGLIGGISGGISAGLQGGSFWAGVEQGVVSGMIAGAAVDIALAGIALVCFAILQVEEVGIDGQLAGTEIQHKNLVGKGEIVRARSGLAPPVDGHDDTSFDMGNYNNEWAGISHGSIRSTPYVAIGLDTCP